ncbi:hypothetical protein HDV02_005075 [Globomyces sp. JEL0801]|nr:hypothetical protein HDV02_005075 [Globomyces sp. JEL0801]
MYLRSTFRSMNRIGFSVRMFRTVVDPPSHEVDLKLHDSQMTLDGIEPNGGLKEKVYDTTEDLQHSYTRQFHEFDFDE